MYCLFHAFFLLKAAKQLQPTRWATVSLHKYTWCTQLMVPMTVLHTKQQLYYYQGWVFLEVQSKLRLTKPLSRTSFHVLWWLCKYSVHSGKEGYYWACDSMCFLNCILSQVNRAEAGIQYCPGNRKAFMMIQTLEGTCRSALRTVWTELSGSIGVVKWLSLVCLIILSLMLLNSFGLEVKKLSKTVAKSFRKYV